MQTVDEGFFNSVKRYNDSLIAERVGEKFGGIPFGNYSDVYAPAVYLKVFPTRETAHLLEDDPNVIIAGRYVRDEDGTESKLPKSFKKIIIHHHVPGVIIQTIRFQGRHTLLRVLRGASFGIKAELISPNTHKGKIQEIQYTIILEKPKF